MLGNTSVWQSLLPTHSGRTVLELHQVPSYLNTCEHLFKFISGPIIPHLAYNIKLPLQPNADIKEVILAICSNRLVLLEAAAELVDLLVDYTGIEPGFVLKVCCELIRLTGPDTGNISTSLALLAEPLTNIALTLNRHPDYRDIEKNWSEKYEDKWNLIREQIEQKVLLTKTDSIPAFEREYLMKFYTALDWRSIKSNIQFDDVVKWLCKDVMRLDEIDIPKEDRFINMLDNAADEMRHCLLLKFYRQYLNDDGITSNYTKNINVPRKSNRR